MTANIRIDTIIHIVKICGYKCNYGYGVDINADMRCGCRYEYGHGDVDV